MNPQTIFAYLLGNFSAGVGDALAQFKENEFYVLETIPVTNSYKLKEFGASWLRVVVQNVQGAEQIQLTITFQGVVYIGVVNWNHTTEDITVLVMQMLHQNPDLYMKG